MRNFRLCLTTASAQCLRLPECFFVVFIDSAPVVECRHYTAFVGETVILRCRPNLSKDVDWYYRVSETSHPFYVYSNKVMYERFWDRMSVGWKSDSDSYDLVINNVTVGDAGHYSCVEDLGLGAKHIAKLTVYGKN